MQFYPTLTIDGTEYSSIEKPVVLVISAGAPLEFDTVEEALAYIEAMPTTDSLPENLYRFDMTGWQAVKITPRETQRQG
jgi:hypothetical protein